MEEYNPNSVCKVCGNEDVNTTYVKNCDSACHPSVMERQCGRCWYKWEEEPLVATGAQMRSIPPKVNASLKLAKGVIAFCYPNGKWRGYANMEGLLGIIQPLREAIAGLSESSSKEGVVQSYIFVTEEGGTYAPNSEKVHNMQVLGFGAGTTPEAGFDGFVYNNPSVLQSTFDKVKCYKSWGPGAYQCDFFLSIAREQQKAWES